MGRSASGTAPGLSNWPSTSRMWNSPGRGRGVVVPWRTYLQEKMWLLLTYWGYPWRE
jgi:hypothetical protein